MVEKGKRKIEEEEEEEQHEHEEVAKAKKVKTEEAQRRSSAGKDKAAPKTARKSRGEDNEDAEDDQEDEEPKGKAGGAKAAARSSAKGKEKAVERGEEEEEGHQWVAEDEPTQEELSVSIDPQARREIRAGYRKLEADLDKNKEKYIDPQSDALHKKLDEGNALYKGVNTTLEALRDSRFLASAASLAAQQAQKLKSTFVSFDGAVMVNKLVTLMGGRDNVEESALKWSALGEVASKYSSRVPTVDFLLGPLTIEHRITKQRVSTKIEKNAADLKTSTKLTEQEIAKNENETPKNVLQVAHCLNGLRVPMNFFEFVINPESFSQTVENIFYLSFLIRDGRAKITIDSGNGQPYVEPAQPSSAEGGTTRKQIIVDITMDQWETLKDLLMLQRSTIPTRPKRTH